MAEAKWVGRCPRCAASITEGRVLITYETDAGQRVYAECPDCKYVAHPQAAE